MAWREALLRALPDIPRWVEARAALLHGASECFAYEATPLSAVLRDDVWHLVFAIGAPDAQALQRAVARTPEDLELIAERAHADHVAAALPTWRMSRATLYTLRDAGRLPAPNKGDVRWLDCDEIDAIDMDGELRDELKDAATHGPIATSLAGGAPAAFCYAGSITETLWDVSIDTLPQHRRRGHAARAAAFMIRHMETQGKTPVWGAVEENPASWRLAEKLGFGIADHIALFTPL